MLSLTTLVAGYRMGAPMHTTMPASSRGPRAAMIIEPELYVECAIYDNDMEESMCKLQTELAEAQSIADDASKRMSTLEENVAELQKQYKTEKGERESLEKQLERSVANAAAASAAAQTLEMQTSKLMQELKDQGVEHATTLERETNSLKELLDEQSSEAVKARESFERVEAEKRKLRDEMDAQISEAGRAANEAALKTEKVLSELAETKSMNEDYLAAIQKIASVAATIQKTAQTTTNE